jgi:hypothetical protein
MGKMSQHYSIFLLTFSAVHNSACLHFEHDKMRKRKILLFDPPLYLHFLACYWIRGLHSACFGCGKVDNRSLQQIKKNIISSITSHSNQENQGTVGTANIR